MIAEELKKLWQQEHRPKLRNFGLTIGLVLIILSLYLWYVQFDEVIYSLSFAVIFILIALFKSGWLKYIYLVWMSIAIILGAIVSRIILTLIFILLFTPAGLFLRLFRKDPLNRAIDKNSPTYWKIHNIPFDKKSLEKQF